MSSAQVSGGSNFETYNPPFTAVSVATAAAGAAVAAWLFAWAYGPAEHYSPIVQLNFVLAGGMGWLIGKAAQAMLRKKRINRVGPAILIGLVGGLVGLWASWLTYIWVIADFDFEFYWECLIHPGVIWDIAMFLSEDPMWSLGKSGGGEPAILYLLTWLVEGAIIVGMPAFMCRTFVKENVLCEQCNEWLGATGDVAIFSLADLPDNSVVDAVKGGDLSGLFSLPRMAEGGETPRWLEVHGYSCPNCEDLDSFVSINLGEIREKKGKQENSVKSLVRFVPVTTQMESRIFEPVPAAPRADAGDSPEEKPVTPE